MSTRSRTGHWFGDLQRREDQRPSEQGTTTVIGSCSPILVSTRHLSGHGFSDAFGAERMIGEVDVNEARLVGARRCMREIDERKLPTVRCPAATPLSLRTVVQVASPREAAIPRSSIALAVPPY